MIGAQHQCLADQAGAGQGDVIDLVAYGDSIQSPDDRLITEAVLSVNFNGQPAGEIVPIREFFVVQQQPMTIPDKRSTLADDLYVILAGWEGTGETATFKTYINPLVNWIWVGGVVFILGTLIAAWPNPTESTQRSAAPVKVRGATAAVK